MVRLCFIALVIFALVGMGCPKTPPEKSPAGKETETDTGKETPKADKKDTPEPEKEAEKEDSPEPGKENEKEDTSEPEKEAEKEEPKEIEVGVIETDYGKIVIEFFPDIAPKTVARIKELIGKGFYNGLTFHRIAPGFCIQGGCPDGTGSGGTGQKIPGEFSNRQFVEGSVGMARSNDPNSNDCQFFITLDRASHLDTQYTLFGHVIEGMEVAHEIEKLPVIGQKPKDTVLILSLTLEKRKKAQ